MFHKFSHGILVLDYGSQYTLLIARKFRELGVYAEIIDGAKGKVPDGFEYTGIVLSGGPDSVSDVGARKIPQWVLDSGKPILGICYGMQLLVEHFGGKVRAGTHREYGNSKVRFDAKNSHLEGMFNGLSPSEVVWMSHGDDVASLPDCFDKIGLTTDNVVAMIAHKSEPILGLQFHPEVEHTTNGKQLLLGFAKLCKHPLDWQPGEMVESCMSYVKETVGSGHVLMGVSGGVDSTVAVKLMVEALGHDRVTACFVDNGLLRKNEKQWVSAQLTELGIKDLVVLDREEAFLNALRGVTEPEQKRKIIGNTFAREFEAYARAHKSEFTHLGQGTLYPDVIESAKHGAGAQVIKTHHNVGGLPADLGLKLVEPFRHLFKDEVRKIGLQLGIPEILVGRHPFPGPGLGVRVLGEVTKERCDILREADAVFIDRLRSEKLYDDVWQAFVVLLPVKTVGVMGDNRTYQSVCALRAVCSSDGMTADVSRLPFEFLTTVASEIVRKVHGINRVVYDITTKPPGTIEWE
ncbi:MAG: glutamine-hydrolyzing GMP synthase [Oligoflexales bacterium]